MGVGGEGLEFCDVVDFGDDRGLNAQDGPDGGCRIVRRSRSERDVGWASGFSVAFKPRSDVWLFVAVELFVIQVRLLGFRWMLVQQQDQQQNGANVI